VVKLCSIIPVGKYVGLLAFR